MSVADPGGAAGAQPTRFDLLKFSYGEVLDATKHSDDKVGRLLGAIAFLTGGALVFANNDILSVDFQLGSRTYPLAAITLAIFILVDLIAVAAFMIAMSAPLTLPGRGQAKPSHLFFRSIAPLGDEEWQGMWTDQGLAGLEAELIDEIMNIAERADKKYGRTTIATNIFLAALVLLAPTVVLGVTAAAEASSAGPIEWSQPVRWSVGLALATVVFVLLLALYFQARSSTRIDEAPLLIALFCYPALLCAIVITNSDRSFWNSGALAVALLGILSVASFHRFHRLAAPGQAFVYALAVLLLTAGSIAAWVEERSDVQLLLALLGGVLVVVPSILNERPAPRREVEHGP